MADAAAFLTAWHAAVAARDAPALSAIIADNCELHSPVVWKPKQGRDIVVHILGCVIATVDNFAYRRDWIDGDEILLEFTGDVAGKSLVGFDKITLDADGRMARIEVLIRPLNTLIEFAQIMGPQVTAFEAKNETEGAT